MVTSETKQLPCVRVEKRRGEELRQALKERKLLRTDAKITTDNDFIYLPLIRELTEAEKRGLGTVELTTQDFAISEKRKGIENILGFKPSFEVVGDIAVLSEPVEPSKDRTVADALMALHRNLKVVAKRVSAVEGVYRTRQLDVIAGEQRTETVHTEHGCRFLLDLEKVYFNPRLGRERARIASQVAQSGRPEAIIDMFAGVGPFAIQIAKRAPNCHVTAIDINPDAIRYLEQNRELNHVQNVDAVVGDIRMLHARFKNTADRIIMNLPKSAYLFLHEAVSMLKPEGGIIHFYDLESAYSEDEEEMSDAVDRAITKAKERLLTGIQELGAEFAGYSVHVREARKVKAYAPYAYIVGIDAKIKR